MASYLIAIFLGAFTWSDARSRCLFRHAALISAVPFAASLLPLLASLGGVEVSIGLSFGGLFLFDFVALGFAVVGFVASKRLIPRFAGAYADYWASLTN